MQLDSVEIIDDRRVIYCQIHMWNICGVHYLGNYIATEEKAVGSTAMGGTLWLLEEGILLGVRGQHDQGLLHNKQVCSVTNKKSHTSF